MPYSINGDIAGTLDASYYKGCGERLGVKREVVITGEAVSIGNGQLHQISMAPVARPLDCMHDQQIIMGGGHLVENIPSVRRLTPLECERLQGFPDGWTDIGEWVDSRGKTRIAADSARYKALGNSLALPYWQWLANRIVGQYDRPVTMGSLFDGIGGFPLVFQRAGATPVWNSEVDEFCEAVTKIRFGEE
jgi:site-specific DNA-cytosine methylase